MSLTEHDEIEYISLHWCETSHINVSEHMTVTVLQHVT